MEMASAFTFLYLFITVIVITLVGIVQGETIVGRGGGLRLNTHAGYDNTAEEHFAPRFKQPTKMYKMDMKPAGTSLRIRCAAEGNPTPNITWYKNKITPICRDYFQPLLFSKWSIYIEKLTEADKGNYTCVVCNELGCIDHTMTLMVQDRYPAKPYIKEGYPGNATIPVNGNITLHCPPVSDLEPYVYWLRPVRAKGNGSRELMTTMANVIESQNPDDKPEQLTIYNITKEDEGWYVCAARNSIGKTTAKGYLSVLEQPPSIEAPKPTNPTLIVSILFTVFGVVLLVAVIIVFRTWKKLKKKHRQFALEMVRETEIYWKKKVIIEKQQLIDSLIGRSLLAPKVTIEYLKVSQRVKSEYELPEDMSWEVPRESLVLSKVLGEGQFGKVVKAECVGILNRRQLDVAVKMLKESHTDEEMKALVSEMEIMKIVGKHKNIVNLLGCCTQNGPLFVIIEFALHGSLREFLRNNRPGNSQNLATTNLEQKVQLTQQDLVSFSHQVAKEKKEKKKIMFIEMFTVQTDVWAFGVLMWEIMTMGATPYRTVPGYHMYQYLRAGHRLEIPPCCRFDVYMLMRECWSSCPKDRPSFTQLVEDLDKILTVISKQEHLDLNPLPSDNSTVTKQRWLSKSIDQLAQSKTKNNRISGHQET